MSENLISRFFSKYSKIMKHYFGSKLSPAPDSIASAPSDTKVSLSRNGKICESTGDDSEISSRKLCGNNYELVEKTSRGSEKKSVGCKAINLDEPMEDSTIIVVGNGRGGTSMVAGALAILGVPMGSGEDSDNHEDEEIVLTAQNMLRERSIVNEKNRYEFDLEEIIHSRNASYKMWGWKDPSLDLYMKDIIKKTRNPRVIFVNRDLAAVSDTIVRKEKGKIEEDKLQDHQHHITIEQAYEISLGRINRYWVTLQELCLPTVLFSYERAQKYPEDAVECLIEFCGISPTEEQKEIAKMFVSMNNYTSLKNVKKIMQ